MLDSASCLLSTGFVTAHRNSRQKGRPSLLEPLIERINLAGKNNRAKSKQFVRSENQLSEDIVSDRAVSRKKRANRESCLNKQAIHLAAMIGHKTNCQFVVRIFRNHHFSSFYLVRGASRPFSEPRIPRPRPSTETSNELSRSGRRHSVTFADRTPAELLRKQFLRSAISLRGLLRHPSSPPKVLKELLMFSDKLPREVIAAINYAVTTSRGPRSIVSIDETDLRVGHRGRSITSAAICN